MAIICSYGFECICIDRDVIIEKNVLSTVVCNVQMLLHSWIRQVCIVRIKMKSMQYQIYVIKKTYQYNS